MKFFRLIAIILCAAMLFSALIGCKKVEDDTFPFDMFPDTHEDSFINNAFAAFDASTIMLHVDDYPVTWEEFFFHLFSALNTFLSPDEFFPDLNDELYENVSYAEAILEYAVDNLLMFRAFTYGAKINNVTFSEEDEDILRSYVDGMVEVAGGVEELIDTFWELYGVHSFEMFEYLTTNDLLGMIIYERLYGESGVGMSDDEIFALIEDEGFLMAKHILRVKPETDDDEEENKRPILEAEAILAQLVEFDGDDFEYFFDELMFEHSEDLGGLLSNPNGYLFQLGDMVQEFYDATYALEIGEYSGLVETDYGYHIILRIPLNYDSVPAAMAMFDEERTLRQIVSMYSFETQIAEWRNSQTIEYAEVFDTIDLSALFVR